VDHEQTPARGVARVWTEGQAKTTSRTLRYLAARTMDDRDSWRLNFLV
jgi:hypothetical protein